MSNLIQTNCPTCRTVLRFQRPHSELATMKCPKCGHSFQIKLGASHAGATSASQSGPRGGGANRMSPPQVPGDVYDQYCQQLLAAGVVAGDDLERVTASLSSGPQPRDRTRLANELVRQKLLTKYQAREVYAGRGSRLLLGNYLVVDKLGDGGMGVVVKAQHRRMERIVALKVLSAKLTKTPEAIQRFQREVKAAAKLEHPNIVTAYDADESNGHHFLVMQFVDGADLSAVVRKHGALSLELVLNYVVQVAKGLEYAHKRGVVHRDIKPSNILLDRQGTIKILDMGLARLESAGEEQDQLTGTGMIMGTVDFMAPEQAMDTRTADGRADIYSLGATMWYLLTARAMYKSDSMMKKLLAHQTADIPSLTEACSGVSGDLADVFRKMVAKQPEERFQNMREVIDALERCRVGLPAAGVAVESSTQNDGHGGLLSGIEPANVDVHSVVPVEGSNSDSGLEVTVAVSVASDETDRVADLEFDADLEEPHAGGSSPVDSRTDSDQRDSVRVRGSLRSKQRSSSGTKWIVLGIFLLAAGLIGYQVFRPQKFSFVSIAIEDPGIEVEIRDTDIRLHEADNGRRVRVAPGQHILEIRRGQLNFETDVQSFQAGQTAEYRIEIRDGQVRVLRQNLLIAKHELPGFE